MGAKNEVDIVWLRTEGDVSVGGWKKSDDACVYSCQKPFDFKCRGLEIPLLEVETKVR